MKNNAVKGTSTAPSSLPIPEPFGKAGTSVPGPGPGGTDTGVAMSTPAPGSSTAAPTSRRPRRRKLPPLPEEIRRTLTAVAKQFRTQHGKLDRETGQQVGRFFCTLITPRRKTGRPMTEAVAVAIGLRRKGWAWSDICPVAIPGFSNMEFYERSYRMFNLREAVRAHRRRRKKQKAGS